MYQISDMPYLPGQRDGRPVVQVSAEQLNEVGANGSAFSFHVGDVVKFEETDTPLVVSQPVTKDSTRLQYLVACEKNGRKSWMGIGIFTRRDATGAPVGDFQEKALKEPSFKEVYAALLSGKTLTCKSLVDKQFAVFKDGERTDELQTRKVPVIEYAA